MLRVINGLTKEASRKKSNIRKFLCEINGFIQAA
jgi:hypothetical protein